ncbi:hypothetical protein TanjilG_15527 [Lupinus angustifolius]|nr:hypothetical protein TanjilG_15527 [Lupinus angustifolius]
MGGNPEVTELKERITTMMRMMVAMQQEMASENSSASDKRAQSTRNANEEGGMTKSLPRSIKVRRMDTSRQIRRTHNTQTNMILMRILTTIIPRMTKAYSHKMQAIKLVRTLNVMTKGKS